jgi:hypothetical protein
MLMARFKGARGFACFSLPNVGEAENKRFLKTSLREDGK